MKNKIKNYKNEREDISYLFLTDLNPAPTDFKEKFDKQRENV